MASRPQYGLPVGAPPTGPRWPPIPIFAAHWASAEACPSSSELPEPDDDELLEDFDDDPDDELLEDFDDPEDELDFEELEDGEELEDEPLEEEWLGIEPPLMPIGGTGRGGCFISAMGYRAPRSSDSISSLRDANQRSLPLTDPTWPKRVLARVGAVKGAHTFRLDRHREVQSSYTASKSKGAHQP